jgi:exodeoxyribonuclease VII large subunit
MPYSVAEITAYLKNVLERDPALQDLWLEGEISNWVRSRAGHCYLTIKDSGAAIRAVIWRSVADRLSFAPEDGQAVLAHGHISVYEPQGQYQFYVDTLQPTGRGALYAQFEVLKARLSAEGLFDDGRKRSVPPFPTGIGVVTSPVGAAWRDILNVLGRRWPVANLVLSPTLVQGAGAPSQIVTALEALYRRDDIDLIIVARGGGSIEDLWAFNDEQVARTIAGSPVPVVCGVGHEIDFTIADFVADLRAPTPSAAAEMSVPDQVELREQTAALSAALSDAALRCMRNLRQRFDALGGSLVRLSPLLRVERDRQRVDDLQLRLERSCRHRQALLGERLSGLAMRLRGLDPQATLARGYAIVYGRNGDVVRSTAQVDKGDLVSVRVTDGRFSARVEEGQGGSLGRDDV